MDIFAPLFLVLVLGAACFWHNQPAQPRAEPTNAPPAPKAVGAKPKTLGNSAVTRQDQPATVQPFEQSLQSPARA